MPELLTFFEKIGPEAEALIAAIPTIGANLAALLAEIKSTDDPVTKANKSVVLISTLGAELAKIAAAA